MEQVFTNVDLVRNLYEYLNFEEQLKFTQASRDVEYIIVNHLWHPKFEEITIITTNMLCVVISDTLSAYNILHSDCLESDIWQRNSFIFTSEQLDIFLRVNADKIKKLQLITDSPQCNSYESIKNALPFRKQFPNLTELICCEIQLEDMDLTQLVDNCAKLETLNLKHCCNLSGRLLTMGVDIDIEILKAMQNLNNLSLCGYDCPFAFIEHIFDQLKLQQLTLNGKMFIDCRYLINNLNLSNLKYYKELNMPSFESDSDFLFFQKNYLPHMENLCKLSLSTNNVYISITEEFFKVLLKSCKSLTHLSLQRFTINDFIALPSLNELILDGCRQLTLTNLRTILSEMDLKCFKSHNIYYNGSFLDYFFISPSLQEIDIKSGDNYLIELLKFNQTNLMNLTEFHYRGTEKLRVSNFALNCKILTIETKCLIAEDCLELKHLQELTLLHDTIAETEFLLLLKHTNLQKLSLMGISYSSPILCLILSDLKPIHTNLRYLRMSSYNKEFVSRILLDLLNINTNLSFACHTENVESITEQSNMNNQSNNEQFPKRFKNINVCGVSIDCNSIRNHCVETMNQMRNLIESLKQADLHTYFILQ